MSPGSDARLGDLFVRYWDDALSADEAGELERLLATDPPARAAFEQFVRQAVAAADLAAAPAPGSVRPAMSPARRWSRRRLLRYVGAGGLAAGVGGLAVAVLGRRLWTGQPGEPAAPPVHVAAVNGGVKVRGADGREVAGAVVPPGGSVSAHGTGASAVLAYPDGTTVTLLGDSTVVVAATGRRLILNQGAATADVRPHPPGEPPLTLLTAQVTLSELGGVLVTLGRAARATEVEVHRGLVTAAAPTGERLGVIREGEVMTVGADGGHRKQPVPPTPDEFAWDLARPLPDGWPVGRREETDDDPVVVPEDWPDPYYGGTRMYQIRSNEPWLRGFVRLHADSRLRVRYRVDRPGPGQVCFCARTPDPRSPDTGMLEWNGAFAPAPDGGWAELEVPAADLLLPPNKYAPKFGPPWVAFLVIVNTYTADLGLRVAEFLVTRPG
jgi:ferric-dicitrate binding protein FerR (iron transport regulator)